MLTIESPQSRNVYIGRSSHSLPDGDIYGPDEALAVLVTRPANSPTCTSRDVQATRGRQVSGGV